MAKNVIRSSKRIATKASALLRSGKTSPKVKSVAGDALVNRKKGTKGR